MGMYTGLRGNITFKEEVANVLKEYFQSSVKIEENHWQYLVNQLGIDLNGFENYSRSSFIPRGFVCYMPSDWDGDQFYFIDNTMFFVCALKDYDSTIAEFVSILPRIAHHWELEEQYEETDIADPVFHRSNV